MHRLRSQQGPAAFSTASAAGALRGGARGGEWLDPVHDERWAAFVAAAPAATIFHHPEWLGLLGRAYGYPLTAWSLVGADGKIRAGIPVALVSSRLTGRRLVCVPFADHCAPLTESDDQDLAAALGAALDSGRRTLGLPLRVHGPLASNPGADVFARYHDHVLMLDEDFDAVVRRFRRRSSLLRGARRAEREGLSFELRTDEDAVAAFYRLNQLTHRRLGVPVQPRRFILGLSRLMRRGLGFVSVVRAGDKPVAAAVFLAVGRTVVYKYGASDPAALGKRPNNLLFLEVIRWACEAGVERFDFGRTDLGHESLRAFKLGFGCEERVLEYHALGERVDRTRGPSRLPTRLAPALRRSPLLVNRALGEMLYPPRRMTEGASDLAHRRGLAERARATP